MKFIKPIDLQARDLYKSVLDGRVKLQCGQWIKYGHKGLSRFVCVTGKTINAVHPQPGMEKRFQLLALSFKLAKAQGALIRLERKYEIALFEHELEK